MNNRHIGEKSDGTGYMDIVLVQAPSHFMPGYNEDLLKYYRNSIAVNNIEDFINRVISEVIVRKRLIRTMVIGSHGHGIPSGYGHFKIGRTFVDTTDDGYKEIMKLRLIAPYFLNEAAVYIVACKTGNATILLKRVSAALGGISVHGYTSDITTSGYGPFGADMDNGTDDGGREIVCWPSACLDLTSEEQRGYGSHINP